MEAISLKLDKNMLKNVDKSLKKHNFSTRTEFIRTAIRDKLEDMTRDELMQEFMNLKGGVKRQHTDKEIRTLKDLAYKQFVKERGWD